MVIGNKKYRAAVIGCGSIGRRHAEAFAAHSNTELVALTDVNPEGMHAIAEKHGLAKEHCYASSTEMLEKEAPDIVAVCTWANLHAPLVTEAAEAGVGAIISEKPLALHLGDVDRMIEACDGAQVKLIVSHQHRFAARSEEARRLIADGVIGEPEFVHMQSGRGLLNNGSHALDMALYVLGDPVWEWVVGQIFRNTDRYERGDRIEDLCTATFGLAGGIRGQLGTDLPEPYKNAEWIVNWIAGTEGMMRFTRTGIRVIPRHSIPSAMNGVTSDDSNWVHLELKDETTLHSKQLDELIDWIEGGDGHRNDAHKHRPVIELLMGIYESAKVRDVVKRPLENKASPLQQMIDSGALPVTIPGRVEI